MSTSMKQGSQCRCLASPEANEILSKGNTHIHCPRALCNCKADYPMTAWRHLQRVEAKSEHLENEAAIPSSSTFEVFDTCESGTSSSVPLAAFGASDSYHQFPSSSSSALARSPCGSDKET